MAPHFFDPLPFSDFPEDVQICILSFLTPSDISSFASTSKRFVSLCRNGGNNSRLWQAMCDRRWGTKTQINKWGEGKISFKLLYKTLAEYENLMGFWRRSGATQCGGASSGGGGGGGIVGDAPLVFFEWGVSCVTGSRIAPSKDGSYNVVKHPFLWMSLSNDGQAMNYVKMNMGEESGSDLDLIHVSVSFMGKCHVVLEESNWVGSPVRTCNGNKKNFENVVFGSSEIEIGSPPDRIMSDMYQYFANRTSPGSSGERAWRRQRRREKERQGRRKWDPEHLVKIENESPSKSRPLQGLWKVCSLFNVIRSLSSMVANL